MTIAVLGCFHASGGSANEASRFHRALEWCNGSLAAPCTRATTGDAGDWLPRYRLARHGGASGRVPSGTERSRLRRRPESADPLSPGGGGPRGGPPSRRPTCVAFGPRPFALREPPYRP